MIITPVVFYEFCRLRNVGSLKDHWDKFRSIRTLVEDTLDVEVLFENLDSYDKTKHYIGSIEHDSELIKARLKSVEEDNLRYDFIRPPGGVMGALRKDGLIEVAPISAADHLYEDLDTRYFNPYYVSLFLKDHMAYKLSTNPENNLEVAKKYKDDYLLRAVVLLDKKERVRGLADIELFSKCNVRHQFSQQSQGTYSPASISLTIDTNLFLSLKKWSGYGVSSAQIIGGEDSNNIKTKMDSSFEDANHRMGRAKEQQLKYIKASSDYIKDITHLFQGNSKMYNE